MAAFNEWLFDAFEGAVFVEEIAAVLKVKEHAAMSIHMQGTPDTKVLGGDHLEAPFEETSKAQAQQQPSLSR